LGQNAEKHWCEDDGCGENEEGTLVEEAVGSGGGKGAGKKKKRTQKKKKNQKRRRKSARKPHVSSKRENLKRTMHT